MSMRWLTVVAVLVPLSGSVAAIGFASAGEPGALCMNGPRLTTDCGVDSADEMQRREDASDAQTVEDQDRMMEDEGKLRTDEELRMPEEFLREDRNQLRMDLDPNAR
jgi:hypothetical protein